MFDVTTIFSIHKHDQYTLFTTNYLLQDGVGCDMALIGHVTAGPYTLVHAAAYSEGRSVYPLDACFHNPCLNGGNDIG